MKRLLFSAIVLCCLGACKKPYKCSCTIYYDDDQGNPVATGYQMEASVATPKQAKANCDNLQSQYSNPPYSYASCTLDQ